MRQTIHELLLFTVTACPIGRSMQDIVKEVTSQLSSIKYKLVYADVHHEITNQYGITLNPTIVFLDERGCECYRVEGFKETQEIIDLIHRVEWEGLTGSKNIPNTLAKVEKYTVYLYKGNELVPVESTYVNHTAVVTPRITATRLLLKAKKDGLSNSFPQNTELMEINFVNKSASLKIKVFRSVTSMESEKMQIAMLYTLRHFGIQSVEFQLITAR